MQTIWDYLFPPRCPVCDRLTGKHRICEECTKKGLPVKITEPYCLKCGKSVNKCEQEYCLDCQKRTHDFKQGRGVFLYRGMEASMYRFKEYNRREYSRYYAEELCRELLGQIKEWNPQVIIPIPIHPSRRRKRGYNQSELLGKELKKCLSVNVDNKFLIRKKRTEYQKKGSMQERHLNLKDAFWVNKSGKKYESVLLVDDIYTTGSTMDAAAKALKNAGIKDIYFVCICFGMGD